MMLKSICICECGMVRSVNQDRAGAFFLGGDGLYLVADGMGGHYAGEKASEAILTAFSDWWEAYLAAPQRPGFPQAVEQFRDIIHQCNDQIRRSTPPGQICGSTLVMLWLSGGDYAIFSVGDSRCYQISRQGLLTSVVQMTTDDTVRDGVEKRHQGKLLQAVGAVERCEVSLQTGQAAQNRIFALCTDGVYKACSPKVWKQAMRGAAFGATLQQTGAEIVQEIKRNGAPDNYSLVLVKT